MAGSSTLEQLTIPWLLSSLCILQLDNVFKMRHHWGIRISLKLTPILSECIQGFYQGIQSPAVKTWYIVGVSGKMQKGPPLGGPSFAVSAWGKDLDVSFNCSDLSPHWIPCLLSDSPCLAGVLLLGKCGDPGTISTSELPVNLADGSVCPPNGLCKLWLTCCPFKLAHSNVICL